MPGIDLNLSPDLQDASRRLSFSEADADSPYPYPSGRRRSNRKSSSRRSPRGNTLDTPTTAGCPVGTSLALAPPGLLQSQQAEAGVSAARLLEEQQLQAEARALFGEYQRQRQHQHQQALAAEAALQLQQAWASAARLRSQELILYTVDGGAAGYATKWKELHPVSQRLLLQIEDKIREYRDDSEQLDQCSHLADLSLYNMRLEIYASQITQVAVEQQGQTSILYILWEGSHDAKETASRVFHPLLGDLWLFSVPLSVMARGRPGHHVR